MSGSGISWAICKSAPRCRHWQTDNHANTSPLSFFYRPDALPATQPTASKHWRHNLKVSWPWTTVFAFFRKFFLTTLLWHMNKNWKKTDSDRPWWWLLLLHSWVMAGAAWAHQLHCQGCWLCHLVHAGQPSPSTAITISAAALAHKWQKTLTSFHLPPPPLTPF